MTLPTITTESLDHSAIGKNVRKTRMGQRISLRSLAIAMGISAPHLSDLERGRRNWTQERYDQAINQIEAAARRNGRKGGRPKGK